jgi:pyridoxamine 5'-phosphate oxidase-like protein
MTASLPPDVQEVFDRFITTEYTTVDGKGQPITWPVTPYYRPGEATIDVTTGLGYPKKAADAERNSKVSLLFSDPTGCGIDDPPMVLVQGTAQVDDRDLDANRERYERESAEKLPAIKEKLPPKPMRRFLNWYFTRLYVKVRPERVWVWRGGADAEPELLDTHLEEVRSGHVEEPEAEHAGPLERDPAWDERIEKLGGDYPTAVVSLVGPDGFPFAGRVPVEIDRDARRIRLAEVPAGAPMQPGLACVAVHEHAPDFTWQRNFHVRGDLVEDDDGWSVVPAKLVGGFEVPDGGFVPFLRENFAKSRRFRKIAKRELAKRS